jgi:hypothetical protein
VSIIPDTLPTGTAATPEDPYDALPPGLEVPRVRTPLTASELRSALILGHYEATSDDVSYDRLMAAWCMACVEHAVAPIKGGPVVHGYAVHCNNLGNIGVGRDAARWLGDWFALRAEEVIKGKRVLITQPLRAHSCATAGATDYWAFLLLPRFTEVMAAFDRGDVESVAHELKAQRYYTAAAVDYARGMLAWSREYARRWPR